MRCSTRRPSRWSAARTGARRSPAASTLVDKDFAIARGFHQGYPKKLGSIGRPDRTPMVPRRRSRLARLSAPRLAAGDRRLAEAVITLREPAETNGFVNGHRWPITAGCPRSRSGKTDARRADRNRFGVLRGRSGVVRRRGRAPVRSPDRGTGAAGGARADRRLLPAGRGVLGRRHAAGDRHLGRRVAAPCHSPRTAPWAAVRGEPAAALTAVRSSLHPRRPPPRRLHRRPPRRPRTAARPRWSCPGRGSGYPTAG